MNDIILYLQTDKEKFLIWLDKLAGDNIQWPKIYKGFFVAWPLFVLDNHVFEQNVYTLKAKIPHPIGPEQPMSEAFELVDMINLQLIDGTEKGLKVIISYNRSFLPPLFDLFKAIIEDYPSAREQVIDGMIDYLGPEKTGSLEKYLDEKPPRPYGSPKQKPQKQKEHPEEEKPEQMNKGGRPHHQEDVWANEQIFDYGQSQEKIKPVWLEKVKANPNRSETLPTSLEQQWKRITKADWLNH